MMNRSASPDKLSPSTSSKACCAFCFSHMTQCRCSPYKVTAHRLQTKAIPELEHDARENTAEIERLTEMLDAANHKYDDVTQPLIAQVEELTDHVIFLNSQIQNRDDQINELRQSLRVENEKQKKSLSHISDLKQKNETLTSNIQKLVKMDICQAAKAGDMNTVALWISLGCDVNKKDSEQWTPLHWASGSGRFDIADLLLNNRADVRAKDDDRWEPLHWAASGGHIQLVNLLLSSQADVNARCKNLHTPMHWANSMGHINVVHVLQRNGGAMTEDQSVLDSRFRPRLKEHESSNTAGIGWSKYEQCPSGYVRLSFLMPDNPGLSEISAEIRPQFEISSNQGKSWRPLTSHNSDHVSWGGRLYLSDPIIITRDLVRCVWRGHHYGPLSLPYEQL